MKMLDYIFGLALQLFVLGLPWYGWELGKVLAKWLDKHNNGLSTNRPEARWLYERDLREAPNRPSQSNQDRH
jgi:hypothetical protein